MVDGPLITNALVRRLNGLARQWRKDAADGPAGGRLAALNMCARQLELVLEELHVRTVEPRGTLLLPARGSLNGRVCGFTIDFHTPCDARGPVWDVVYYDRAVVADEPHTGSELRRIPACFAHGAAEQARLRQDATEEDQ